MNNLIPSNDDEDISSLTSVTDLFDRAAAQVRQMADTSPNLIEQLRKRSVTKLGTPESRYARALLRARRQRDKIFGPDLFGEPVWDMMLNLFAAHDESEQVTVSSLCIAAAVPPSTAIRYIAHLEKLGWLERSSDKGDARKRNVSLSQVQVSRLRGLLKQWMKR